MTTETNNEYALGSEPVSEDETTQTQISSSEDLQDEFAFLSIEDQDSERSEETPFELFKPWDAGEKGVEETEVEEFNFLPRQKPRTDYNLPESQCSPDPIGEVQMRISRWKTETTAGDLPPDTSDVILITCMRQGLRSGVLKAIIVRRNPPSPAFSSHLKTLYNKDGSLRRGIQILLLRGLGIWGAELEEGDCMYIERIHVLEDWEGLGIGKKMTSMVLNKARELNISWVFTYPHSFQHRERRHPEGCIDLAIYYWRQMGFRRLGTMDDFCYSMDPSHPSRDVPLEKDYDNPWDLISHDPSPEEEFDPYEDVSSRQTSPEDDFEPPKDVSSRNIIPKEDFEAPET